MLRLPKARAPHSIRPWYHPTTFPSARSLATADPTVPYEQEVREIEMLKKAGVKHVVLNAKYHEKEAEIVAQAGRKGSVTIATNMAGRGTDILLVETKL